MFWDFWYSSFNYSTWLSRLAIVYVRSPILVSYYCFIFSFSPSNFSCYSLYMITTLSRHHFSLLAHDSHISAITFVDYFSLLVNSSMTFVFSTTSSSRSSSRLFIFSISFWSTYLSLCKCSTYRLSCVALAALSCWCWRRCCRDLMSLRRLNICFLYASIYWSLSGYDVRRSAGDFFKVEVLCIPRLCPFRCSLVGIGDVECNNL